jgi:hypothetical protein
MKDQTYPIPQLYSSYHFCWILSFQGCNIVWKTDSLSEESKTHPQQYFDLEGTTHKICGQLLN